MRVSAMLLPLILFSATMAARAQSTPAESPKPESAPAKAGDAKPKLSQGGVEILSDTQGVDFKQWLKRWHEITKKTWDPLIPDEVRPPAAKSGMVAIRFKVLPNGRLMDRSLVLEIRSGDTALDRVGRLDRLELSSAAQGVPRPVSRDARVFHVQHGAATVKSPCRSA